MGENRLQKYDGVGFVTLKGMAQMHSTKPNKTGGNWSQYHGGVDFYNTNIPRSDWAVSQRYGVISLVNSPPSTHNFAHALSCVHKSKLK